MASGFTHDILVSYVAADREWGERIAAVLGQRYKVATVMDGASTNPALLGDARSYAERIMPILSQSSKDSADAKLWLTLLFEGLMDSPPRLLPVKVDKVDFEGRLGTTGYIKLMDMKPSEMDTRLLEIMEQVMGR